MSARIGPSAATSRWTRATWANLATVLALATGAVALLGLHGDTWWIASPRPRQWAIAAACVAGYVAFCGWIGWRSRSARIEPATMPMDGRWLIVHASQTGFAHELADRTAALFAGAQSEATVLSLGQLQPVMLTGAKGVLFVASTTGEGDPPHPVLAFVDNAMSATQDLSGVHYGVLALGDRAYARYCGFGHQLDAWLRACGATPLFDLVEVDNGEPAALRHWQHHVGLLCGSTTQPDWTAPTYTSWTLRQRRLLNGGSAGGPAWHLALQPPAGDDTTWQAGDILEIGPCNAADTVQRTLEALHLRGDSDVELDGQRTTLRAALARSALAQATNLPDLSPQALVDRLPRLPHREYSIASLPDEGAAWLLVREMSAADGQPGLGSGWLCRHADVGGAIAARVRVNPNFHAPDPARPMLLIGNGTGIAGLRAHLAARIAAGARRNWLLFGERSQAHDAFYDDVFRQWQADGWIERMDRVFSRDGVNHRYVQDALRAAPNALRDWHADGCTIYLCGSLQGMAPGVDAALREVLGGDSIDAMLADGRYRRDVY